MQLSVPNIPLNTIDEYFIKEFTYWNEKFRYELLNASEVYDEEKFRVI